jgi:acyl carrier protein
MDDSWTLEDLGATSFDSIQLFMLLEEHFDISFSREQIAELVALPVAKFHEVVGRAHAVE